MRTVWKQDFPDTIIDRALKDATTHPLYLKAKNGDVKSGYFLARDLVTQRAIQQLNQLVIDKKKTVIVPVHALETISINMIPLAISQVLSAHLGIPICTDIVQSTKVSRTSKDGWYRVANSPRFKGDFPAGYHAIILDDTQTQGGTLAALKGFIEYQGGEVIASYALTGKQYSKQLRLSTNTLKTLRENYGTLEEWFIEQKGYSFACLTEWEARFILNSRRTPDAVRNILFEKELKGRIERNPKLEELT
ncbi:recombinase [Pasteurella atlantica]|uniref:Recombinase n=2 Tax=Pasteurellaceae TaxID=712 RepID=A0ACC6HLC5_9PAST|nr:recombinase [Pasteurella atlantica]MDP8032961.1 recombinase [Pasteurella atlantica]MDP8034882.1 recombinase [Pasteurella atlantica]MDP8036848.1 recombinase [Pasteurella atlantica]MDP8047179.1 recombinase [Pasteurella atlantica]MDP8049311.1 recombinase [Pasteurella atlantica]